MRILHTIKSKLHAEINKNFPEGFKTAAQIAKEEKTCNSVARKLLSMGVANGIIEKRQILITTPSGVLRKTTIYKLKT